MPQNYSVWSIGEKVSFCFSLLKIFPSKILATEFSSYDVQVVQYQFKVNNTNRIYSNNIIGNKEKERISKRVLQEDKARQIFRKRNICYTLIPTWTCGYLVKNCSFFGKFGVLCFLVTPGLRFAFLPYCCWYHPWVLLLCF